MVVFFYIQKNAYRSNQRLRVKFKNIFCWSRNFHRFYIPNREAKCARHIFQKNEKIQDCIKSRLHILKSLPREISRKDYPVHWLPIPFSYQRSYATWAPNFLLEPILKFKRSKEGAPETASVLKLARFSKNWKIWRWYSRLNFKEQ